MRVIKIGVDPFLKKDVKKIRYTTPPNINIFNASDVAISNPSSNLAVAFVYTWKKDKPPRKIRDLFSKVANYSAITGYWRTTNGAKYAFSNILANPNINKLLVLVFGAEDNGHLLVDALTKFWTEGINKEGIIKGSKAANPKFEGISLEALKRIKKQTDLLVYKNITKLGDVEKIIKAAIQEPRNAINIQSLGVEFYSKVIKNNKLYDDGCRFEKTYKTDLISDTKPIKYKKQTNPKLIGGSLYSKNLKEALQILTAFIFKHGETIPDQRGIETRECRSLTIVISNPLESIPKGFSKDYLERYTKEFMEGIGPKNFAYTYHSRLFKKWGDQPSKAIEVLKKSQNTRRALISLWDPSHDISEPSPPCLNLIWATIRNKELELHALYRSHHIATITKDGKVLEGDGAFIPNAYALAVLQKRIADELCLKRGALAVTDFSSHLYISKTK